VATIWSPVSIFVVESLLARTSAIGLACAVPLRFGSFGRSLDGSLKRVSFSASRGPDPV